ncbi:hypothetical protein ACVWZZ_005880 [Bradyrhizobium sp. LM6.10]
MSPRRHSASSSMAAAAMPLAELERWLQVRVDRHPAATSLPMLDGYVAAIVAGPVSISPLDWICPLLAIDADAFNHGGTPEFAAISAVALRHNEISQILSTTPSLVRADAPAQSQWRRRSATLVPGILCRNAAQAVGVGAVAGRQQRQSWPASAHPAALSRRSGPAVARTGTKRARDQGFSAQRPRRSSSGRRGHVPILDADPLRSRPLITADVGAHTGYGLTNATLLSLRLSSHRSKTLRLDNTQDHIPAAAIWLLNGSHAPFVSRVDLVDDPHSECMCVSAKWTRNILTNLS